MEDTKNIGVSISHSLVRGIAKRPILPNGKPAPIRYKHSHLT